MATEVLDRRAIRYLEAHQACYERDIELAAQMFAAIAEYPPYQHPLGLVVLYGCVSIIETAGAVLTRLAHHGD